MGHTLQYEKWQIIIGKIYWMLAVFMWPNAAIDILCASKGCKYLEIRTSRYYFCIATKIK